MSRALILVAHADDETLGAGGIIQKLVKQKWDLSVVIMSDGIVTARGELQNNRAAAAAACAVLGAGEPIFLDYPDQKLDTVPMADLTNAVAALDVDPDLIVTHVDTDLNMDHRLVCEAAKIIGRPKTKPVTILGCEVPNTSAWNAKPFPANFYLDITEELDRKIEAMEKYTNERRPFPHPWSREGLTVLAQYHGMQSGYALAEAFHVIRGAGGLFPG